MHADFESLSIYDRPCDRNNQNLEGAHNGAINLGKADIGGSSRGSYNRWIATAQKEEGGFTNREYQINVLKAPPKTKDKKLVDKDNAIESLVKKHKSKEITLAELLQHYTLLTNEKVLPRNLRHFSSDF